MPSPITLHDVSGRRNQIRGLGINALDFCRRAVLALTRFVEVTSSAVYAHAAAAVPLARPAGRVAVTGTIRADGVDQWAREAHLRLLEHKAKLQCHWHQQ